MITTLLIDADIVAYQFAAASQQTFDWGDCDSLSVKPLEEVTPLVDTWLTELQEKLDADALIICLSCPTEEGWRKDILPTYKENRKNVKRPEHLSPIKDYLEANYPSYRRPTLEADDIMGILSTHPTLVKGKKIIVSEDKDMLTIPGWLFNPRKDRKPWKVTEEEANYWHMYQTLVGDATDNYKGCPGIGPVKAEAALHPEFIKAWFHSLWESVAALYQTKGFTEEDALIQARVARICRDTDYDFKKKRVKLWEPPQ